MLVLQYVHKPSKFDWNPQLLGSLEYPAMQVVAMESAGSAQLVKSARNWLMALEPAVPQRSGLERMVSSLRAKSAYVQC